MINDCTILGVSLLKVRKVGMRAWSIVRYTQLNEEKKGKTIRCFTLLLTYTHGNVPSITGGKATTRTYTHTHAYRRAGQTQTGSSVSGGATFTL